MLFIWNVLETEKSVIWCGLCLIVKKSFGIVIDSYSLCNQKLFNKLRNTDFWILIPRFKSIFCCPSVSITISTTRIVDNMSVVLIASSQQWWPTWTTDRCWDKGIDKILSIFKPSFSLNLETITNICRNQNISKFGTGSPNLTRLKCYEHG